MKNLKKILAVVLAGAMMVTGLAACGKGGSNKNSGGNTETDIEISYWNAGLGTEWLDKVIEAFEKENPEYNVYYKATSNLNNTAVTYGMEGDTVDLYLVTEQGDLSQLEPLDDVVNGTAKGDSKPLSEKFNQNYLEMAKAADGHYYQLTYGGGVIGIVYNTEHFKEAGIEQAPRTTNELALVCDTLKSNGKTPFIHFKTTGYWDWMIDALFCQYNGFDYLVNNFYACKDANGNSPSAEVFTVKDGRYEVMKAYEKIITPEYVFTGSNTMDHTTAQTQFLNGSASMMTNGSWLASEMASVGGFEKFEMMRTPVISAITDKLTTVKSEPELRKLISAIDSVADGEKTLEDYKSGDNYNVDGKEVSAADWDYVYTARFTTPSNYNGENAYIPSYSNSKEGAKAFLSFLYSDAGYKIYADAIKVPLPLSLSDGSELDMSSWNAFQKSQVKMLNESEVMPNAYVASRHRIFIDGGVGGGLATVVGQNYVSAFCATNPSDRMSADELWDKIVATVNDNYENVWLKNIKQ